jgi:hypothetical protein
MARTKISVTLEPSRTDQRPDHTFLRQLGFSTNIGNVIATQLDENSVILVPVAYIDEEPDDTSEAKWRDAYGTDLCWKTTAIYEQIGESHPHVVE